MIANRKVETQGRTAQLGIKINAELYEKYKALLKKNGSSITEDIENYMRDCVGEMVITSNVIDIAKLLEDVEELKQVVGELRPDWQNKITNLRVG